MLRQTKTTGSGKHKKTIPKYTLTELLDNSRSFDVANDPDSPVLNDGYNDDEHGSVVTPGGLILPRRYRAPS